MNNSEINVEKLVSIIVQCFGLVIIGYVFSRFEIISQDQSKGLSAFTSKLSLPALIFISLAKLNFSSVNWNFVFLIFFAKLSIFLIVCIITLVLTRPANIGLSAIYAIFCTQGNDFAFGYPILSMLYGSEKKEFLDYLYILVPIQLLILNPIGIFLLETHSLLSSSDIKKKKKSLFLDVFKSLIYNPINFITFIGIVWNLLISNKVPVILESLLDTAANSFSATALFLLGFSLKGRFQQFKNSKKLVLPIVIVAVKIIVSPLINRLFVEKGLNIEISSLKEYSSFAFLIGTIPTAPTALIFALEYNLKPDIIASALVICIVFSSPIMLISINMVSCMQCLVKTCDHYISNFLKMTSIISLPCIIWVLIMFLIGKKYKYLTHRCLIIILVAQFFSCLTISIYDLVNFNEKIYQLYKKNVQYIIVVSSLIVTRIWVSVLALIIILMSYKGLCFVLKIKNIIFIFGSLLSVVLCSIIIIHPNNPKSEFYINYENCPLEARISSFLLLITFIMTVFSLIVYQHNFKKKITDKINKTIFKDEISNEDQQENFSSTRTLNQPSTSKVLNDEDLEVHEFKDFCLKVEDSFNAEELEKAETEMKFYKEHDVFSHFVFLLITAFILFISLQVNIFKMVTEKENGIKMELQLLDYFLNYGLGIFPFILFGFDFQVLTKFFKKNVFKIKKKQSVETISICDSFKKNHLANCEKEILFSLNDGEKSVFVFKDQDLIKWLINNKVVINKKEGQVYCQKLLEGNIIELFKEEKIFQKITYLFKFN